MDGQDRATAVGLERICDMIRTYSQGKIEFRN